MKYLLFLALTFMFSCDPQPIGRQEVVTGEGKISDGYITQKRAQIRSYQANVQGFNYRSDQINSSVACIETAHPTEDQIQNFECDNKKVAVCHIPYGNPANAHIIIISKNAYKNTYPNNRNNRSQNYLVNCKDVQRDLEELSKVSCSQTCKYQNYQQEEEFEENIVVEEEEEEEEEEIVIVEEKEEVAVYNSEPYRFDRMSTDDLKLICNSVCGSGYHPQIRNFYQLSSYPYPHNKGLYCGSSVRLYEKTPCHNYDYHLGISTSGISWLKTELHRGGWAAQRDAAWCIGYHERDYPELETLVIHNKIIPGQIACGQLVDKNSLGM